MRQAAFYILLLIAFLYVVESRSAVAATVSGTITFNQVPVSGVTIYYTGSKRRAVSKRSGLYTITFPAAGTYTLTIIPKSRFHAVPISQTVQVAGSESLVRNFNFASSNLSQSILYGRVSSRGLPLENVTVVADGVGRKSSDGNGFFWFDNVPQGRLLLSAQSSSYTFSSLPRQILIRSGRVLRSNLVGRAVPVGNAYATFFAGIYDFSITASNSTCDLPAQQLSGVVSITQSNDRISARLPGLGTFRGRVQGSNFSVPVNTRRSFCRVNGVLTGVFQTSDHATTVGDLSVSCLGQPSCSGHFEGRLARR